MSQSRLPSQSSSRGETGFSRSISADNAPARPLFSRGNSDERQDGAQQKNLIPIWMEYAVFNDYTGAFFEGIGPQGGEEQQFEGGLSDHIQRYLQWHWEMLAFKGCALLYPVSMLKDYISPYRYTLLTSPGSTRPERLPFGGSRTAEVQLYRALDPALVINILGRLRAGLLLPEAAIVFDQVAASSVVSNDPQLVRLVKQSRCEKL